MLTKEQAGVLATFIDAFELHTTGVWVTIETSMRDEFGIEDPEAALEEAREALNEI